MRWIAPLLGVATVALGVSVAEAKMVRYEVNGQRFSFSTKDRAQFELARQRINAANAAVAARAKANAELAAHPLVRAFGSQSQNEVKAAEANLAWVLATAPRTSELSPGDERTPIRPGANGAGWYGGQAFYHLIDLDQVIIVDVEASTWGRQAWNTQWQRIRFASGTVRMPRLPPCCRRRPLSGPQRRSRVQTRRSKGRV